MLWLALHFPHLPLEIFTRRQPPDKAGEPAQPMVVLDNNRVCMRNPAAAECGIVLGATLATAHSICPTLRHQQYEPDTAGQRLTELAGYLYRFSSHVSVQQPDCILLEIGASLRLFGNHEAVRQAAVALCQSAGHDSVARVAQTPWAAIALARSAQHRLADVSLTHAGLELAGVPAQTIERFDNMGIYTLGPILELPSQQLGKRFGKKLLIYLEQLTGTRPDPRQALHPAPVFDQQLHLLEPVTDKEGLACGPMAQLTQELQHWLVAHQLGCTELQWTFFNKQSNSMSLTFADPRQNAADILRVSQLRMEQAQLPAEVLGVGLHARQTQAWRNQSQPLFQLHTQPTATGQETTPDALLDELNARLGDGACSGLVCLDQHTPELAWCAITGKAQHKIQPDRPVTRRPVWLFEPPRAVRRDELTLMQGPERIQSSWWVSTTCRDYYIARHSSGAECWAFVDAASHWYLHGYFS
ncbi:MAG: DNA polymerase Y family protein [Pseudomonadales bacterium]